jgi:hypothetical protein
VNDQASVPVERVYALLRRMPLGEAIVSYLELELELNGRTSANVFEIALALGVEVKAMKTLANTLPMLARAGRVIVQGSGVSLPDASPTVARDQPEVGPDSARQWPDNGPRSGSPVNDDENASPSRARAHEFLDSSKDLKDLTPKNKKQKPSPAKKPKPPDAQLEPPPPDLMFETIAQASFGGLAGLTEPNAKRCGAAKRQLVAAGFSPQDVLDIVAWVRDTQTWRTGIMPQVIVEQASPWRNRHHLTPPARAKPQGSPNFDDPARVATAQRPKTPNFDDPERMRNAQ